MFTIEIKPLGVAILVNGNIIIECKTIHSIWPEAPRNTGSNCTCTVSILDILVSSFSNAISLRLSRRSRLPCSTYLTTSIVDLFNIVRMNNSNIKKVTKMKNSPLNAVSPFVSKRVYHDQFAFQFFDWQGISVPPDTGSRKFSLHIDGITSYTLPHKFWRFSFFFASMLNISALPSNTAITHRIEGTVCFQVSGCHSKLFEHPIPALSLRLNSCFRLNVLPRGTITTATSRKCKVYWLAIDIRACGVGTTSKLRSPIGQSGHKFCSRLPHGKWGRFNVHNRFLYSASWAHQLILEYYIISMRILNIRTTRRLGKLVELTILSHNTRTCCNLSSKFFVMFNILRARIMVDFNHKPTIFYF